jgi:hypothetical protein
LTRGLIYTPRASIATIANVRPVFFSADIFPVHLFALLVVGLDCPPKRQVNGWIMLHPSRETKVIESYPSHSIVLQRLVTRLVFVASGQKSKISHLSAPIR